jgi:uncharacterized membrane-anchored protein
MAADVTHRLVGVPCAASTALFAGVVAVTFFLWHRVEGTLSIHDVDTRRRTFFYWAAVMATFALGTAAGDWAAYTLHFGFATAGLFFLVLISMPALAYRWLSLNGVVAFWWAYVLTRPVGASFADYVAVSPSRGGLGWGTGPVSAMLAVVIVILVGRRAPAPPAGSSDVAGLVDRQL